VKLLKQYARYAIGHLEPTVKASDSIKKQTVRRQVTLVRHLPANRSILKFIEIRSGVVKNRVVSQPERLVYLKVKTYRWHNKVDPSKRN
jgi:hypothetical protein